MRSETTPAITTLSILRTGALVILLVGLIGTIVELLLLKHTDGFWQLTPLALLGAALLVIGWYALTRGAAPLHALRLLLLVFLVSGVVGTVQHFLGNISYEKESDPSISGRPLYQKALMGSTPALAPGTMIQLGLVGLLFVFRHPTLARTRRDEGSLSERTVS